jgi:hypothetical protein
MIMMRWVSWAGVALVLIGGVVYAAVHVEREKHNNFMEKSDE